MNLPRNSNGQFVKGFRSSPETEFKKGQGYWTGKKRSPETIKKMSKILQDKPIGVATRFKKGTKARLGVKHTEASIKKMSENRKGKPAWNKGIKCEKISKEKHWNWKGGVNSINDNIRHSLELKRWRWEVFVRDNFTCQICGAKGGELRANHIKRFADYPKLRTEISNGITIHRECDIKWVLGKEQEWESYFNFNLMTRRYIL